MSPLLFNEAISLSKSVQPPFRKSPFFPEDPQMPSFHISVAIGDKSHIREVGVISVEGSHGKLKSCNGFNTVN